ncbi:hypothetical protein PG990_013330 [Apiospora arundinis]
MLAYQGSPNQETLERWDPILTATADYMASYAWKNETSGYYDLGPPAYGVTENTPPAESLNLAYEPTGTTASASRSTGKRSSAAPSQKSGQRSPRTSPPLPTTTDTGTGQSHYAVYEGLDSSWWNENKKLTSDPRSLIMLQGILPDIPPLLLSNHSSNSNNASNESAGPQTSSSSRIIVDPEVARATSERVWDVWGDGRIRGWGRPVLAMNSARIGRPDRAVYHLTAFDYWKFDDAGFAIRGGDGGTPPPFMPGNAGLLYADFLV